MQKKPEHTIIQIEKSHTRSSSQQSHHKDRTIWKSYLEILIEKIIKTSTKSWWRFLYCIANFRFGNNLPLEDLEEQLSETNQEEIKSSLLTKPASLNIAFLYNDQKLNTKHVLQKLASDVVSNQHNLEMAYLEKGALTSIMGQPDLIFFFYFISNAREHFEEIEAKIGTISATFAKVPIHLFLLKDENCRDWPLDKSRLQTLDVTTDYFAIYSCRYAEFALSPKEFTKPTLKQKYVDVHRNYKELCQNMSEKLNS